VAAAADSKTLAEPIKRDKLDEIFQAQKLGLSNDESDELLLYIGTYLLYNAYNIREACRRHCSLYIYRCDVPRLYAYIVILCILHIIIIIIVRPRVCDIIYYLNRTRRQSSKTC